MKLSINTFAALFSLFIPSITACKDASISGTIVYKQGICPTAADITASCNNVKDGLIKYSLANSNAWGHEMSIETKCDECFAPGFPGLNTCTCTVTAHRYREWLSPIPFENFMHEVKDWGSGGSGENPKWVVSGSNKTRKCD
ncbi:hypothetical protein J1614_000922 [Plenodomus biglobosus]|nr:hypothetical protein J1614_000922 [Plenodomus biglobosus]